MINANSMQTAAGTIFDNLFETATWFDYNPNWVSSGDTFNSYQGAVGGVHAPELEPGELICSMTPTGRRMLILGTELGNAVAFTPYMHSQELIAQCCSPALDQFIADTKSSNSQTIDQRFLTVQGIARVFGCTRNTRNISRTFEAESAKKRAKYLEQHQVN